MRRNAALIVVVATVLVVHLVFYTGTYHVSDVKSLVFIAGLAALVIALTAQSGWERIRNAFAGKLHRSLFAGVAAFVLLSVLSVLWAKYRLAAGSRAFEIVLYAAWALGVFLALRTRRDVMTAMSAFLVAGLAAAAIAFGAWGLFLWKGIYPQHATQFFLPMGNPNWLAVAMLIPMMLCVAGFCRRFFESKDAHPGAGVPHKLKAGLFALGFLLMAATVWKAGSHSSAAAFAIALALLPALAGAKRRWLLVAGIAGVLLLACIVDLSRGHSSALRSFGASKSVAIRLDMWRWGMTLAKRNPVSGLGAGAYFPNVGEVAAPDFDARPGYFADIEVHAHNEFIETFVELGIFGLVAFLWPVGTALGGVFRRARDDTDPAFRLPVAAFAAGWLALLLQSTLDVGMRFESVPVTFWTGLGVLAAALRLSGPAPAAEPELRATPRATVAWVAVPIILLAGYFIVSGFDAAVAMKDVRTEPVAAKRVALLRTAASGSVAFVDRVRARNELGRLLAESGSPRAASDEFRRVLDRAGFFHDAEGLLASTLLDQDRVGEAMTALCHYAGLRPADPLSAAALVRWLRRDDPARAMARATKLVRDYPDFSKVYIAAGALALQFVPPDEAAARANFERALAADPGDPQALWLVGFERQKENRVADAVPLIETAYARGFRSVELILDLAELRRSLGRMDAAAALLAEGLQLFPNSKAIRQAIGKEPKAGD